MRSGQIYQQRSLALTVLGAVLFLPPLVLLFMTDRILFGVPVVYLWLFGAWLVLILAGRGLARRLDRATRLGPLEGGLRAAPTPEEGEDRVGEGRGHDA